MSRLPIIGFCGPAGCGKDLAASMVPGAIRCAFADPIYDGLAAMLGVPMAALRDRARKELPVDLGTSRPIGKSPRELLQTLGTDWGRALVADHVWVSIAEARWERYFRNHAPVIVVPDVRFDNEAEAIHRHGGEVWYVRRERLSGVSPHVSERSLSTAHIDRVLFNVGTPEQLRDHVAWHLAGDLPSLRTPPGTPPSGDTAQLSTNGR